MDRLITLGQTDKHRLVGSLGAFVAAASIVRFVTRVFVILSDRCNKLLYPTPAVSCSSGDEDSLVMNVSNHKQG